jgi:MurNAc alpha-1-phosphate uridylyltransferase
MIDIAMILAAGAGERLRPLTDGMPKPLLPVAGRSLLERSMDRLTEHGVSTVVVNVHHLGQQIAARLEGRARVVFEEGPLETGSSVNNALPLLGRGPFFVLNGGGMWCEGPIPMLHRLQYRWNPTRMDALLLLHPIHKVIGREAHERGDYFAEPGGRSRHRGTASLAPYVFAGVSVCDARLFRDPPDGAFSLLQLWNRAEAVGRLFCLIHEGDWCPVGTPEALAAAERALA